MLVNGILGYNRGRYFIQYESEVRSVVLDNPNDTGVECWAIIPNKSEREAVMAWVRMADLHGYSVLGEKVTVTFIKKPDDSRGDEKLWGIIGFFERYPEHGIFGTNLGSSCS